MNNKKWYVYCHTNKENNKKYVGITKQNPIKRWDSGEGYKTVKHNNGVNTFYEDIQKYGWENFTHEILYSELTVKEANNKEIELIQKYSSLQPNGYNISKGGGAHDNQNRTKKPKVDSCKSKIIKETYSESIINKADVPKSLSELFTKLNENGVFVYTALRVLLKNNQSSRLTYKDIYLSLCSLDNIRLQNKIICRIKAGLNQLVNNGMITVKDIDKSTMLITPISMQIINRNLFFSVPLDNINKVMKQNDSINLLYKYLYIISTINIKSGIGFYSQENIASNLNMSIRTINRAFKTFCDLEILFKSSRSNINKKGEFINMTNIYSLDKECLGENQYNIKAHKDLSDNVIDMDKYIDTNINRQNNDVYCDFSSCPF